MDGNERRAIDRRRVYLGAGRIRFSQRAERYAPVLGNEHAIERDRVRAAPAQPGAEPGVEHVESRHWNQEQPHIGMVIAGSMDEAADHDPLGMADAARPGPLAIEAITAGCDVRLAAGRRRGGNAGIGVPAPDVMLRLVGEVGENAGVIAQVIETPRRRAAGRAAELDRDVEGHFVVVLVAAPPLRHDGAQQAGRDVFLHRLERDVALALGTHRALAQLRRQRLRATHQFLTARNFRCGGSGRQHVHGAHRSLLQDGTDYERSPSMPAADRMRSLYSGSVKPHTSKRGR